MNGFNYIKHCLVAFICLALTASCQGMNMGSSGDPTINDIKKDTVNLTNVKLYLAVNYNEQLQFVDFYDMGRTKAVWVSGFLDFFQLYDQPAFLATNVKVAQILHH